VSAQRLQSFADAEQAKPAIFVHARADVSGVESYSVIAYVDSNFILISRNRDLSFLGPGMSDNVGQQFPSSLK
jgi:hypothetical protein